MTAPQAPDWSAYSHRQIWDMVMAGEYEGAGQVALDYWTNARVTIMVIEKDLQQGLREIGSGWEGQAADAAAAGIGPLGQWALDAVERGQATTDALHNQSDYAYHTLRNMPPPDDADIPVTRPAGPGVFAGEAWDQADRRRREDEARARDLMAAYQANSESNTPALVGWTAPPQVVFGGGDAPGSGTGMGGAGSAPAAGGIAAALNGPSGGAGPTANPGTGAGGAAAGPYGAAGADGVGGSGPDRSGTSGTGLSGAAAGGPGASGTGPGGAGSAGTGPGSAGLRSTGAGVPTGSGTIGAPGGGASGGGADGGVAGGAGAVGAGAGRNGPGRAGPGRPGDTAPGYGGSATTGRPGSGGPGTGPATPGYGSTGGRTGTSAPTPRLFAPPGPGGSTGTSAPTNWRDVVRANGGFAGGAPESGSGVRPPTVEQTPRGTGAPATGTSAPTRTGHPISGHPGMMPMTGAGAGTGGETRRRAPYLVEDTGVFDVEHLLHFGPPVILPPDHPDYH